VGTAQPGVSAAVTRTYARLEDLARSFPDAWEDHPWGDRVFKVNRKIFLFLALADPTDGVEHSADAAMSLTVKLPDSHEEALTFPFVTPTGYGLGRAGWVTARFRARARPPAGILADWVDESYRAVALKRQVAELDRRAAT
jgi:predicted DNA-binding protein (MmcQ/YjbR family)